MHNRSKIHVTLGITTAVTVVGAVAWGQNLNVKGWTLAEGSAYLATLAGSSVGVGTSTPRFKLEVSGPIINTAAYNANANLGGYDVGVGSIGTSTLYGYRAICTGNARAGCDSTGGVTLSGGSTIGTPNVAISGAGSSYFNAGNVGIGTTAPAAALHLYQDRYALYGPNSSWGAYLEVGGNGRATTYASVVATNGNLHIDSQNGGYQTYINHYSQGNTVINGQAGNVGIGTGSPAYKLDVNGAIAAGNSDLYFTYSGHNYTGIGNAAGYAAIENAANYGTLMILGRAGTSVGRRVDVWDYLQVNGTFNVTGSISASGPIRSSSGTILYRGVCSVNNGQVVFDATCTNGYGGPPGTFNNTAIGRLIDL